MRLKCASLLRDCSLGVAGQTAGTITDDRESAARPGPTVTITNVVTGIARFVPDEAGRYRVAGDRGQAELTGFQTAVRKRAHLNVGSEIKYPDGTSSGSSRPSR